MTAPTTRTQSVEQRIVAALGAIYGPYSGACFAHTGQTDIEHMVAASEAIESVLSQCDSTEMVMVECGTTAVPVTRPANRSAVKEGEVDALALWDDNGNGRITCAEARKHGIAPVPRGHPAYRYMRDGDGDGVVCE